MLQVALPVLLFAPERTPTRLTLKGGTNCDMAPQIDYIEMVRKCSNDTISNRTWSTMRSFWRKAASRETDREKKVNYESFL